MVSLNLKSTLLKIRELLKWNVRCHLAPGMVMLLFFCHPKIHAAGDSPLVTQDSVTLQAFVDSVLYSDELDERSRLDLLLKKREDVLTSSSDILPTLDYAVARLFNEMGQLDSAVSYYENVVLDSSASSHWKCESYGELARNANQRSNIDSAIHLYHLAYDHCHAVRDTAKAIWMLRSISYMIRRKGEYTQSLEYSHHARKLAEVYADKDLLTTVYNDLATIYMENGEHLQADTLLRKSLALARARGDNHQEGIALNNLGRNLGFAGKPRQALEPLTRAQRLDLEASDTCGWVYPTYNLGHIYLDLQVYDTAWDVLNRVLSIARKCENRYIQSLTLIDLGVISDLEGRHAEAIEQAKEALSLASGMGLQKEIMQSAEHLYKLHRNIDNEKEALFYLEMYLSAHDSLFNQENNRRIARLEAEYELQRERQQLELKAQHDLLLYERQLRKNRTIQFVMGAGFLLSVIGVLIFGRFVRLRNKANAELSMLNQELSDQKKMVEQQKDRLEELDAVKSRFYDQVSHDFRSPLTVIKGMTDQITGHQKPKELISRNVDSLLRMTDQILDLRKLESDRLILHLVHANIVPFCRYVLEPFQVMAQKRDVEFKATIGQEKIMMDFDAKRFEHILSTLLSSAFSTIGQSGGGVRFDMRKEDVNERSILQILISHEESHGNKADARDEISDRSRMGMSETLTHELVNLMGGSIQLNGGSCDGHCAEVQIPITNLDGVPQYNYPDGYGGIELLATRRETINGRGADPLILLVDDSPDILEYLGTILNEEYRLKMARNGETGIEMAIELRPDLIVSDLVMPVKDGIELCSTLKAHSETNDIPIILLSAKADQATRNEGIQSGADAYLVKPFDEGELKVQIESLLQSKMRNLHNRNAELQQLLKEKTEQIYNAQNQLLQQQKMASLGQLTAGIAHEIKNPLNFVNNFAEGTLELLDELKEVTDTRNLTSEINEIIEELRKNAVDILENGSRANRIVGSMMDHVRNTDDVSRELDLNTLIEANIGIAYHSYRAMYPAFKVFIDRDYSDKLPGFQGYPQELGRAMVNILNNAFQAVVNRYGSEHSFKPRVEISTLGNEEELRIVIRDNGGGIRSEIREKIFEPFFSTKASHDGHTGLGLSISYDIIVQRHGGQLSCHSEGGSTEFEISLPVKMHSLNPTPA